MKELILVRHAKSDWTQPGQADFDRGLNARGLRVAPKVGKVLKDNELVPELIVSSPALRARLTSQLMAEQLGYDPAKISVEKEIYEASTRTLLAVINQLDDRFNRVMLFGHNPSFTYITEYLTNDEVGDLPTGGVVKINFELDSWTLVSEGLGKLVWKLFPREYDF